MTVRFDKSDNDVPAYTAESRGDWLAGDWGIQMAAVESPRLAIIGCGSVVELYTVLSLRRIGWLPSALVDSSPRRLAVIAGKMRGKGRTVARAANWQSVAGEFDAAIIALPHALHAPTGTALAEAGKHVFVEKPLATTGRESHAIVAAAERAGVTLSVGLLRRYLRLARWTKALLGSGVLGEIRRFEAREGLVFATDTSSDALLQPKLAGGGVLMDTGAHTLDLLQWWLGEIDVLSYRDDNEGGVEADCILECRLASGGTGTVELSRTRDLRNSIRIDGTLGYVEVHLYKNQIFDGSPNALAFQHEGIGAAGMKPQFVPELFDAELADFRTAVSGKGQVGVSGREGSRSVELIERCYAVRRPLSSPWIEVRHVGRPDPDGGLPTLPRGSKVMVTGASGFVGGRLVERLVGEQGARVRCIFRNTGRATRVARLPVEIMRADLASAADIDRAVDGVDYVFHCAYDHRSRSQNVEGLRHLIDACARNRVRRLVHVSTCAVYEPFPDGPLTEETRDGDRSMIYVKTKLELEKMVAGMAADRGVPATIIQPSIVYGPFCKSWTNLPAEMLIFGNVILPDEGEGLCNAVYIDDLVDGLILAAVSPEAVGHRFIMSGPQPVTWGAFFTEIARALGARPPIYRPSEQIAKADRGFRKIGQAVSDPQRIVKAIVGWYPARQLLQTGLDAMPGPLRAIVMNYYDHYFGAGARRVGQTYVPDRHALALYRAKAVAGSEKARSLLGYKPRFDFARGMALTGEYLTWAYEDLHRSAAAQRAEAPPRQNDQASSRGPRAPRDRMSNVSAGRGEVAPG
jgi:nucleoside-diphosphate-sugar epimerase/predicted dehydrogenase